VSPPPVRIGLWLAGGSAVVAASVARLAATIPGNIDDAFILMVYVRHLVSNGALFWNATDGPVDGFTSFLDLLLKSAVALLTGAAPLPATFWTTVALHAAVPCVAMALVFWFTRERKWHVRLAWAVAAGLLLGTSPPLAEGSSFLLETPLYAVLGLSLVGLHLACDRYTRSRVALLVGLCVLVSLARPEGVAIALGVLAVFAWEQRAELSLRTRAGALLAFAAIMAAYYAWHFWRFSALAPNTYYAKASASRWNEIADGWAYVKRYFASFEGAIALLPVIAAPLALWRGDWIDARSRRRYAVACVAALGTALEVVVAGGDCYAGGRFLALPALLGLVTLFYGATRSAGGLRIGFAVSLSALGGLQVVQLLAKAPDQWLADEEDTMPWPLREDLFACERRVAEALLHAVPQGGAIAETDFQRLKYFADDLRVIDLHGLSDREIAHQRVTRPVQWGKYDPATAVRLRPEAWVWGPRFRHTVPMTTVSMKGLLSDSRTEESFVGYSEGPEMATGDVASAMDALFVPASLPVCGYFFNVLVRKDTSARFAASGFAVRTED
jgi:hypothetical protein